MNPANSLPFLLLFCCLHPAAQEPVGTFSTERLGSKDGMSHSRAICVHQDTKGIFWIGTYDGLNRYDGIEFQVFRPSKSGFSFEAENCHSCKLNAV